jgi:phage tail sheath protein FI
MSEAFIHGVEVVTVLEGARPIKTARFSVAGIIGTAPDADADLFPLNTPVRVLNSRGTAGLGSTGSLPMAAAGFYDNGGGVVVVVRVEEGADEAGTIANIVGDSAALTGVHAFKAAESMIKITPRILTATGWTHQRLGGNTNPVVAELKGVAKSLRAVVVADGPNTTDAEAIQAAADAGSERIYLVDPWVTVFDTVTGSSVIEPASARAAGMIVRTDNTDGFWHSPSNKEMDGITGLARPIVHERSNADAQTNLLNEANVSTIIHNNGFRLWGNRGTGQEPLLAFLSVVRTYDAIDASIERALDWASDKPISSQLVLDVGESIDAYIRRLRARGALLGGSVWFDPDLNTKETLKGGRVYLNYDREAPAPLERLTLTAYTNGEYYTSLVDEISTALGTS